MENQKIIVVVEDVDAARFALRWAVENLLRNGDLITLLHVFPCSRSKNKQKQRVLRLKGFQLALSFKDLCVGIPEAKVEIIVTEGDQGATVASLAEEIGASTLVLGLHDHSFLYKLTMANNCISKLNCRVLAVKQPSTRKESARNVEFSQIEITRLRVSEHKTPLQIFPNSLGMIWRSRRSKESM
ncbi:adenine nucleotide alpha hydrolases-like superfamily protein [Tasmannia lanceolata]|uniref:adenine nucleotide alpha hydrolases-like superfamily protein n=1 Tax=Tasmannia lanceolata TaxID=3420 RepID=UPI004063BC20